MATETETLRAFLGFAASALPAIRFFRRNVGVVQLEGGRTFRAGVPGQCDLYGIVRGTAQHLELELKNVRGTLSVDQKRWRDFCATWGIVWLLLRMEPRESTEACVARWAAQIRTELGS